MLRTQRPWLAWAAAGTLLLASSARAIYLDEDQNVTLRARIYSQAAIRMQDSQVDTEPVTYRGQLVQQRNFFNPELDAKLTSYTNWMRGGTFSWLAPDDLRFRVAGWGFYDGIYDYGSAQFNRSQLLINESFNANAPREPPRNFREGGWFVQGPNVRLNRDMPAQTFGDLFPNYQLSVPRSIYANSARVNELYLSYTNGPFFLRFGRQSISWGESDTIALLDQSNPFDLTLGAPGFFEDIDEARIPLYTARASYNLFDVLGPLSSGFVEAYWVPGWIDATTATTPILTASPYSPRGVDPQLQGGLNLSQRVFPPTYQFVFFDHTLKQDFSSSRWGFRFQTVINRFLTAQTWVYRTYPSSPVPLKLGYHGAGQDNLNPPDVTIENPNNDPFNRQSMYIISLEHKPMMVYGLAGTFFLEQLDGIVRLNAQFFEHEAGFIPRKNLLITDFSKDHRCQPGACNFNRLTAAGSIPYQDILRYEVGFDRFFFLRTLNPTNSFLVSASAVSTYNSSWTNTATTRFRFNGQLKPSTVVRNPPGCGSNGVMCQSVTPVARGLYINDYVDGVPLDAQFQTTFQTDYLHGRLTPRLTLIQFVRGTFAFHPTLVYRWNDWLLLQSDYQYISGAYQSLGFFRDRDQVSFRVTYQLN
jgi:hypothetical protein